MFENRSLLGKLCLIALICQVSCISVSEYLQNDVVNKWVFSNMGEENSLCRNHSLYYLEGLKNMQLWATEMYDANAKFPSGLLYGSAYGFGRFDECLDISVPHEKQPFTGKYCMIKVTITPNYKMKIKETIDYEFGDYNKFYNVSAWEKVLAYKNEKSKASRSDIYFSFCLPSSCTEEDLQNTLHNVTKGVFTDLSLTIQTGENKCQSKEEYIFSGSDIAFISILSFFAALVAVSSMYDLCTGIEKPLINKASGKVHEFLLCFSLPLNIKKLSTSTNNEDGLDCLAGIKVISMFLIILGHRCMFTFGAPIVNPIFIEKMYSRFEATAILNGPIIVDTFFLISGFLASYFTLCALKNYKNFTQVILIYVHRIIRMTPAYGAVVFFYCTIFVSIGSGPFWQERIGVEKERCLQSWWTNLLYVNNYINADKLCMFQSWYIACDMHYFLLIPLIVIVLKKNSTVGVSIIVTLILSSILVVLVTVYVKNEDAILLLYMKLLKDPIKNNTFKNIYIPSHMRSSPYFVGVLTGYIKYRMKNSAYKLPKWLYTTGWVLATFISLVTLHLGFIFYLPSFSKNSIVSAVYAGFHHFTFSAGIAWLIIAVSSGKGSWVEPILSWKPFILLSRISYSAFLCHGGVQLYTAASLREPNYASLFQTFYASFGDIVMSYCIGFLLSMVFESPIIGLEKLLVGKKEKGESSNTNQNFVIQEVRMNTN